MINNDSGDDADLEIAKRDRRVYKKLEAEDYKTSEEDKENTDIDMTKVRFLLIKKIYC